MTREEAIFILCAIDVPEGNNAFIDKKAHQAIQMAIDALSIEHASGGSEIPNGLDKAARKSAVAPFNFELDEEHLYEYPYLPIAEQKFIEGAKWQKEQDDRLVDIIYQQGTEKGKDDMKEQLLNGAVEGEIHKLGEVAYVKERNNAELTKYLSQFNNGDRVKIIVIHETDIR